MTSKRAPGDTEFPVVVDFSNSKLSAPSREGDLSGLESEGREGNDSAQVAAAVRGPN